MQNPEPTRLRIDDNTWVSRFIEINRYDRLLTRTPIGDDRKSVKGVRHYASDGPEAHRYVSEIMDEILQRRKCGRDVVESLEWATSELIGNVFHHAESPIGMISQVVILEDSKRVVFVIADAGMGIRCSLRERYKGEETSTDARAIEFAIQRGITSKRENQGWGLFGSTALIRATNGHFRLWSGNSMLTIDGSYQTYLQRPFYKGTVVEWILPLANSIDLKTVLENPSHAQSFHLEQYEPRLGTIEMILKDECDTFRDRPTGKKLRMKLLNLVENSQAKHCVVDFGETGTVSSSFADEFLGKLAIIFGTHFISFVSIRNVTDANKAIIEIAIQERLNSERAANTPMLIETKSRRDEGPPGAT